MSDVFDELGKNAAQTVQYAIWYQVQEYYSSAEEHNYLNAWKIVAVNLSSKEYLDAQSQLIGVKTTAPAPVPEPATMLLLGTGLVGLAGIGRKKMKKS